MHTPIVRPFFLLLALVSSGLCAQSNVPADSSVHRQWSAAAILGGGTSGLGLGGMVGHGGPTHWIGGALEMNFSVYREESSSTNQEVVYRSPTFLTFELGWLKGGEWWSASVATRATLLSYLVQRRGPVYYPGTPGTFGFPAIPGHWSTETVSEEKEWSAGVGASVRIVMFPGEDQLIGFTASCDITGQGVFARAGVMTGYRF